MKPKESKVFFTDKQAIKANKKAKAAGMSRRALVQKWVNEMLESE